MDVTEPRYQNILVGNLKVTLLYSCAKVEKIFFYFFSCLNGCRSLRPTWLFDLPERSEWHRPPCDIRSKFAFNCVTVLPAMKPDKWLLHRRTTTCGSQDALLPANMFFSGESLLLPVSYQITVKGYVSIYVVPYLKLLCMWVNLISWPFSCTVCFDDK